MWSQSGVSLTPMVALRGRVRGSEGGRRAVNKRELSKLDLPLSAIRLGAFLAFRCCSLRVSWSVQCCKAEPRWRSSSAYQRCEVRGARPCCRAIASRRSAQERVLPDSLMQAIVDDILPRGQSYLDASPPDAPRRASHAIAPAPENKVGRGAPILVLPANRSSPSRTD